MLQRTIKIHRLNGFFGHQDFSHPFFALGKNLIHIRNNINSSSSCMATTWSMIMLTDIFHDLAQVYSGIDNVTFCVSAYPDGTIGGRPYKCNIRTVPFSELRSRLFFLCFPKTR